MKGPTEQKADEMVTDYKKHIELGFAPCRFLKKIFFVFCKYVVLTKKLEEGESVYIFSGKVGVYELILALLLSLQCIGTPFECFFLCFTWAFWVYLRWDKRRRS